MVADGDERPRPAPPPSDGDAHAPSSEAGDDAGLWSPLPQKQHRSIPDLFRGTFGLISRRFRDVAVISIVAAAVAVISVAAFSTASRIVEEEILENPKLEEWWDLPSGDDAESEAWDAFVESVSWNRITNAALLFIAAAAVSIVGGATTVALSLVTLDDVEGRPSSPSRALLTGLARVPKIVLLWLLYAGAFLAMLAVLGVAVVVAMLVHPILGMLAALGMLGVTLAALAVFAPLIEIHLVMAYVESGFPSPAKWWRLLAGNKLATWGRSVLLFVACGAAGVILWLILQSLPSPYGDFISNVIVGPLIAAVATVAFALMYADLSGRSRRDVAEPPELSS